jgi:tetratricopeptide (TPR) repeat protein
MQSHRCMAAILTLLICTSTFGQQTKDAATSEFVQGKALIENNCGECLGASQAGVEMGIAKIESALEHGYRDRASALWLLAGAYNSVGVVYAKDGSQEQKRAFASRDERFRQALAIAPNDARILFDYAKVARGAEQLSILRKVVQLQPDNADAKFSLGILLVQDGQVDEGIPQIKRAVELANPNTAKEYADSTAPLLIERGRKSDADAISGMAAKKLERALKEAAKPK